jgi:hypothetical protein
MAKLQNSGCYRWCRTNTKFQIQLLSDIQPLTGASKETGPEVYTEKTKCMLVCRHQNAGQNHDRKIVAHRPFKNVAQFKYLGCVSMREILPGISRETVCFFPNPEKNQSKNRENGKSILTCRPVSMKQTGSHGNESTRNNRRNCWKWRFLRGPYQKVI